MDLDMREQNDGAERDALGRDLHGPDDSFPALPGEPLGLLPAEDPAASDGTAPAELIVPEDPEAVPAGDLEKRKRRREHWEQDQEIKRRWELQKRIADISTDVELLSREVTKVRSELHVPLPPLAALPDFEKQTLDSAHNRRLSDIIQNHCRKTLANIMAHKWSWPFNAPVDTNIYKDYLEKVTTPMDFGTIKKRVESKEYTHPDAFSNDVSLVFNNAKAYNKPGSDVYVMAVTLQEKFEEKYASAVATRVSEENTVAEAEAMAARRRYAGAAAAAGGPAREAAEARAAFLIKYIDQVNTCVADAKSAAAALCAPVSREEKEALATALGRLPQAQFEAAVGVVMHHHPGLQPFDEVGFDLDMLDALTLRQLMSFVAAAEDAAGAEAAKESTDQPSAAAQVQWPAVPVGSGVRPYTGKRRKKVTAEARAQTPAVSGEAGAANVVDGGGGAGQNLALVTDHQTPATVPLAPTAASEVPIAAVSVAVPAAGATADHGKKAAGGADVGMNGNRPVASGPEKPLSAEGEVNTAQEQPGTSTGGGNTNSGGTGNDPEVQEIGKNGEGPVGAAGEGIAGSAAPGGDAMNLE